MVRLDTISRMAVRLAERLTASLRARLAPEDLLDDAVGAPRTESTR